ncbi:MAG: dienelactone hydrolase family protein, partial [Candidatus Saccharimonadales bacterium]
LENVKNCFGYLYGLAEVKQLVSVIGFCFGGTYSFSLAVNEPRLKLALAFYGHADYSVEELKKINCPVRAFYGKNDEGLTSQTQVLPNKMEQASVNYEQKIYPDCGHAFFNDSNKFAYNSAAANDAWRVVLGELAKLS